jgi:hypothetical protein
MSSDADDRPSRQSLAEQAALDQLVERLAAQFPELSAEEIARVVREKHAAFAGSRIRAYVPIFVGRLVWAELSDRAAQTGE